MNFLSYIMIVICFCTDETICKSIHVHDGFHSEFEVTEGRTLNHRRENISKISWIKLKPIIRREMQHVRNVKDAESTTLSSEATHQIPTNEDNSSKNSILAEKEENAFHSETKLRNNSIIRTPMLKSNLTLMSDGNTSMLMEAASNDANSENPKHKLPLNRNDFPYNISADIMNENGDLIVFLTLNENENKIDSLDSNKTLLVNEGTTVTLEGISTTGLELLDDFKAKQNLIHINHPNGQRTLHDKNDATNFKNEFNLDFKKINDSKDRSLLEITEKSTEKSHVLNAAQKIENSFKDEVDRLQVSLQENNFTHLIKEENYGISLMSDQSKMSNQQGISSDKESNMSHSALVIADKIEIENIEPDLENSFKHVVVTEVSSKSQNDSKCPDPGLCIFWFLALDTCDEDSHCHGSLICCRWGCSKLCMDADVEFS